MAIKTLDAGEFRRALAGLSDTAGSQDAYAGEYRELASDFVLLLAICFNRRQLEVTTLWNRIDSAIQKGLAECNGDDLDRFVSAALEHIIAPVGVVASQDDAVRIQEELSGLALDARLYFLQYLAKHRYPAIVMGRKKWQELKEQKAFARQSAELAKDGDQS